MIIGSEPKMLREYKYKKLANFRDYRVPRWGEILIFRKVHKKSTDTSQIMPQPKTTQI